MENNWNTAAAQSKGQAGAETRTSRTEPAAHRGLWARAPILGALGSALLTASSMYVAPVSYTHLDVYKRQAPD